MTETKPKIEIYTKVLERIGVQTKNHVNVPLQKENKINLKQCLKSDLDKEMKGMSYALFVGSLSYVQVCTRSNIIFAIWMQGR